MSIKFSDVEVEYKQFLNDVSKAVAKMIRKDIKAHDKMLTTSEAAEVLGITPDRLRHIKDRYSPKKKGDGAKQGRLLFRMENLMMR